MKKLISFIITLSVLNFSNMILAQPKTPIQAKLENLEKQFDGRLGVFAINTNTNQIINFRENERFPIQSTFKLIGVSALLKASHKDKTLLKQRIHYTEKDMLSWHPVTGRHLKTGMTLEELAEAAMSYSDNPAINLIMKKLGGPKVITNFAHSIGNPSFNVMHYEGDLNSDPKNNNDTSTPKDMAMSLKTLLLGNVLAEPMKDKLLTWMRNNTTSYNRIRAGSPIGWAIADKTGSGDYGISNDVGMLWSPTCKPIILAIYTVQKNKDAKKRDDIVVAITTTVLDEFSKGDPCFKELSA